MKKSHSLLIAASAAALLGAGCAASSDSAPTDITPTNTAAYGTTASSTDQYQDPTPVATSSTPSMPPTQAVTSTPSMETLAFPGVLPAEETHNKLVHLKTTKGDIVFELLPDQGPKAASNFVYLTKHKFYDGLTFHRIVPGFVIQGGDPTGTGMGGPGYQFEDDTVSLPYSAGIVAMANAGPNTNGSQFFIMLADNPLPPNYSIFGRVVSGMDAVQKMEVGDKMTSVTLEDKKADKK